MKTSEMLITATHLRELTEEMELVAVAREMNLRLLKTPIG